MRPHSVSLRRPPHALRAAPAFSPAFSPQVEVVDLKAVKRLAVSFERKLRDNTAARTKARHSAPPAPAAPPLRGCSPRFRHLPARPSLPRAPRRAPPCPSPHAVWPLQHAGAPEKFLDSELELHEELRRLTVLAAAPDLYPELVRTQTDPRWTRTPPWRTLNPLQWSGARAAGRGP